MLQGSIKKFCVVGLLLGLFGVAYSATVAPLYFGNTPPTTKEDSAFQKQRWDELMKYKLWGTHGINVLHGTIIIADNVGYNGTADGDFEMADNNHHFGGPTIVGGSMRFINSANDKITVGPVRVAQDLQVSGEAGNVMEGNWCVGGTISSQWNDGSLAYWNSLVGGVYNDSLVGGVYNNSYTLSAKKGDYADCDTSIAPAVEVSMTVPNWPDPDTWDDKESFAMNSNYANEVAFIHVPPDSVETNEYGTFDKYYQSFTIGERPSLGKKLYILMPPGGKLTRIYSKAGFAFYGGANDLQIVVAYVKDSLHFDRTTMTWDIAMPASNPNYPDQPLDNTAGWEFTDGDKLDIVSNKDYSGNLLFYTKEDISWEYWADANFQGSWISKGTIRVGGHFKLAGQIIADNIIFTNNVTGDFRYVPFDPPILDFNPEVLKGGKFIENDSNYIVPISLDTAASTRVTFNYCFDVKDSSVTDSAVASRQDFHRSSDDPNNADSALTKNWPAFPICDIDTGFMVINKGDSTPAPGYEIIINVAKDRDLEGDESLALKVFGLEGAVMTGNKREGTFYLPIIDDYTRPWFTEVVLNGVVENSPVGTVIDTLKSQHNTDPCDSCTYSIVDANGNPAENAYVMVSEDGIVTVKDSALLDYESINVISIRVRVTDVVGLDSIGVITIPVIDVNESPVLTEQTFSTQEQTPVDATIGTLVWDDLDTAAAFRQDVFKAVGGDTGYFTVTADGKIQVVKAVDYETEKHTYMLDVKLADKDSADLYVVKTITINVTDKNELPVLADQHFSIDELLPPHSVVDTVKWDDLDTAAGFRLDVFKAVGGDTDVFAIDEKGEITSLKTFNFEDSVKTFTLEVKLYDKNDTTLAVTKTMTITIGDKNEPPHFDDKYPNLTIRENAPADTTVGVVAAIDEDDGEILVYTIIDPTGTFKIDSLTGTVKVIADSTLDYETKATYEVKVVVTDKEGDTDTAFVTIKVKDINEAPSIEEAVFAIDENSANGDSVGAVVAADPDTAAAFRKLDYKIIETGVPFSLDSNIIRVEDKDRLNYEVDTVFSFHVLVTDGEFSDTALITVKLNDVNEPPEFTDDRPTLTVDENVPAGTEVGPVTATDVDEDDSLTYSIKDPTDTFVIDSVTGMITVKADSTIDYETKNVYTVTVIVTDKEGLTDTAIVTIKVNDLNEAPEMDDQELTVAEDKGVGDTVGTVIATDPDILNPAFGTLTYTLVEESELFDLKKDGTVVLKDTLDYESGDSVFVIKVRVTDGELSDTALVTIRVTNKEEWTDVKITRAETRDSVWLDPDTVFINTTSLCVEWKADGKLKGPDCEENLHEGENIIIKEWKNPTKDYPGYDTLVVYVSTASPEVKVTKIVDASQKPNIFTIVEKQAKSDSSFYVNDTKNDIQVLVRDPVSGEKDSFVVKLDLDTLNIPSKTFTKTLDGFVDAKITLNDKPSSGVTYTPMNGGKTAVSYTEKVGGKEVTVTYYTDEKGKVIKNDDGVKVMTVTYETKVGDQVVKISYQVDAKTGEMVKSSGGYASNDSSASSSKKADEPEVAFTVSYDYVDEAGNTVTVTYGVDAKGNLVRDGSGNLGYEVGYTYTNKYGNTATQSVFIVLDLVPPKVEILSPLEGDIIYSNFVDVKWTVDIGDGRGAVVQDTLVTQGLEKGGNVIVRFYRDKAGNEASDTIRVIMKNAKDVDISVEKPVTIVTREKVEEYYAANEPEKGETFAVTIYNTKTDKEVETMVGGEFDAKEGSGDEPYPGLTGHLGPTLGIDTKVPTVNAVGGLATLDDLLNSDGVIPMEGVDAEGSVKLTTDEYVERFCSDEFAEQVGSDISKANLFKTSMRVKIWIYTSLGQFVDYYSFTQDLDNPDYVNDAGMLTLYFEMKPDRDGNVRTDNGRLYATGAYVYKTEVELKSTLRCSLPPFDVSSTGEIKGVKKESNAKGSVRTTKEDLLKSFGYKRPKMKKK